MTKLILAVLVSFAAAVAAHAAECRLERPLPFSGDILQERYLSRVRVDQTPRFLHPDRYDPSSDELAMLLFHMQINGGASGLAGASSASKTPTRSSVSPTLTPARLLWRAKSKKRRASRPIGVA
jgi:hypothetical protein